MATALKGGFFMEVKGMSIGYLGHMGIRQESAFGQEATPPEVYGEIFNESMTMDNRLIRPDTVNGSRFNKWVAPGPVSGRGGISTALVAEGLAPWLLKGLFGDVSSEAVAAGVYDHTFTPAQSAELPSFTVEVDYESACQNWIGSTVTGATISISPNDLVNLSVRMLSQRPRKTTANTPSYNEVRPFTGFETEFTLNGVENVSFESFSISVTNNVEQVWTLNGKRYPAKHVVKGFDIEGTIALEFSSDEERRRMWGSASAVEPQLSITPGSILMKATQNEDFTPGYARSITLDIPEIYYASAPANISAARDRIVQTVSFFGNYSAGSGKLADIVLRNGESGYPNP